MAIGIKPITDLSHLLDVYSILNGTCSETSAHSKFLTGACKTLPAFCKFVVGVADADPTYDNLELFNTYVLKHMPSGSSTQNFLHYGQLVNQRFFKSNKPVFKMYDRGIIGNLKAYGQMKAPELDLTTIPKQVKIRGFVGKQDKFGDLKDNAILNSHLSGAGVDYK